MVKKKRTELQKNIIRMKQNGVTSRTIAERLGTSTGYVNVVWRNRYEPRIHGRK